MTFHVEEFRRAITAEALALGMPLLPKLTLADKRALRAGDVDSVIAKIRPHLLGISCALVNAPSDVLAERSYGFGVKQKELDRLFKLALPETLRVHVEGEIRSLPDAVLLERVGRLVGSMRVALPAGHEPVTASGDQP